MTAAELQTFLRQNIPAAQALDIQVIDCTPQAVTLLMPYRLNHNHKNTVFGGSIALGATLCGWSAVHINCPAAAGNIVIQTGETRYLRPATSDLLIRTQIENAQAWQEIHTSLNTTGKGKITLKTEMYSEDQLVAVFSGKYVAVKTNSQ
ncbi:MAG: YiiD C-terminal domain-containing protein [Neisseria sp.]|uniref:YiiD C-terminal domain-containing protein n=1 Tax=Neisseria sp. TaxID=192066 RepID=UPI0026DCF1BB|nr:YiiD C-terminal domain-containing protein [Neisseria sp.]MDO4640510.1 YiiD C-terminal domain-containing protein [Neisseria sp.]